MTTPSPGRFAETLQRAAELLDRIGRMYVELHDFAFRGHHAGSLARLSRGAGRPSDPTAEAASQHAYIRARLSRAERRLRRIAADLEALEAALEDAWHPEVPW